MTPSETERHYSISKRSLQNYTQKLRDGTIFHDCDGRPSKLDPEFEEELKARVNSGRISLRTDEYHSIMQEMIKSTFEKHNIISLK
jgi:transposase